MASMDFDYKILAKYITNELTLEEQARLREWSSLSEDNTRLLEEVIQMRMLKKFNFDTEKEKTELALASIHSIISKKSVRSIVRPLFKYVAILFVVVLSATLGWYILNPAESYVSIVVKPGEAVKKIILEDGSVVWLNSSSTLRVPESFSFRKRVVSLEGEAFFDITKHKGSSFRVQTEYVDVKVLGTSFNLNTHTENNELKAVLVSGKISLQNKEEKEILRMSPSEMVTYNPLRNEYSIETVNTNISSAWHLNQMTFENSTLREIVNKLSMIYDVNINLESKELADRRYRCVINREETLEEVLDILKLLAPINYRIDENEVFINN